LVSSSRLIMRSRERSASRARCWRYTVVALIRPILRLLDSMEAIYGTCMAWSISSTGRPMALKARRGGVEVHSSLRVHCGQGRGH
jgi:hypothetical protein